MKLVILLSKTMLILMLYPTQVLANVIVLTWTELIPEEERARYELYMEASYASAALINHDNSKVPSQIKFGSSRTDLNGKTIKINGFIIPLEGGEHSLTEFMLVPFVGACIHVPPPPPNQMIYVKSRKGVSLQELWAGVSITGVITPESVDNEIATIGYTMELSKIEKL